MGRRSLKNIFQLIDTANNRKPVEQSFLADLKRSIEMTDAKNKRVPSKTYKPSGMNCIRANYYQIVGVQPDEQLANYTLVGICNSGTDIHVRIQTAVEQMTENGMDCEYIDVSDFVIQRELEDLYIVSKSGMETKLYHKKLNMSFMCDGIIKYRGNYYVLELKTESSFKFQNRREVDPSHYNQATAYSLAFGIDDVLFVYISRDILDMKAFMLNVTDEMRSNLVNYITECDGYVQRQITPPKPSDVLKKTCSYCNYRTTCKKDGG